MRRVMQTRVGGPNVPAAERGNCWAACVASILDCDIEEVDLPHSDDPDHHWGEAERKHLATLGIEPCWFDAGPEGWPTSGVWIAGVPSMNLGCYDDGSPVMHVVVMEGDQVWHDPSTKRAHPVGTPVEDLDVRDGCALLALGESDGA